MNCDSKDCSFAGNCYSDGSEICTEEIGFGNCWVCVGGALEYRPRFLTGNYPERL